MSKYVISKKKTSGRKRKEERIFLFLAIDLKSEKRMRGLP